MRTDHDKCLYIIHKYMVEHPSVFSVDQPPSYGIKPGYDLVARNLCMDVIEHVEVELDATDTKKFHSIAEKGKKLYLKHSKPVRLWMVSTFDKWIRGVRKAVNDLEAPFNKRISVQRISPIDIGERRFPFQYLFHSLLRFPLSATFDERDQLGHIP